MCRRCFCGGAGRGREGYINYNYWLLQRQNFTIVLLSFEKRLVRGRSVVIVDSFTAGSGLVLMGTLGVEEAQASWRRV